MFVGHGNPYSLAEVFAAEKQLGFSEPIPIMFLCPPWVLTMIAPLGFFHSYIVAWLSWLATLIAAVAVASKLLMDIYFGSLEIPEISSPPSYRYLFAFTFYPVLMALKFTQLSPLVFLGVAGLVHEQTRKRPIIAGLFLSITLLKPHLVLLLWVALLVDRQWKILGASATVISILSLVTVLHYRTAFADYLSSHEQPLSGGNCIWDVRRNQRCIADSEQLLDPIHSSPARPRLAWLLLAPTSQDLEFVTTSSSIDYCLNNGRAVWVHS